MKKIVRILLLLFFIGGMVYASGIESNFAYGNVQRLGDLIVDFHVPIGRPIFVVNDMKPGDKLQRKIDVKNKGNVPRIVRVGGLRRGGIGLDPKIETALEMVIKDGPTVLYGPKKLSEFFSDSQSPGRIQLNSISPGGHKSYNFRVRFPIRSGNEFQKKSVIFDLRFSGNIQHPPTPGN